LKQHNVIFYIHPTACKERILNWNVYNEMVKGV